RNGEPAALMDYFADFARWFSLQVGKLRTDAEKMAIGCCYFYSRENEKIIHRQAVQSHQAFLEQVIDRIARVVIGNGDAMQAFGACGCNHVFRTGDTVPGKERMCMQVDVKGHRLQDRLERVRCKALVSTKRRLRECLDPNDEARRNDKNRLYSRHLG